MKQFTSMYKWLFLSFFLISMFLFINISIQPELYYHLQQPSFLSLCSYFQEFAAMPGGIAQYLANFLSQFFYYGWAGAFVIAVAGSLIMVSGFFVTKRFLVQNLSFYLSFLPFVLMVSLLTNYYFQFVVVVRIMLVYMAFMLYILLNEKWNFRLAISLILLLAVYYIAGSGSLVVFAISIVIHSFIAQSEIYKKLIFASVILTSAFLITFISYKFLFPIAAENRYLEFYSGQPSFLLYKKRILYHLFCFSLPIITLVALLLKSKKQIQVGDSLKPNIIYSSVIIILAIVLVNIDKNEHKKNVILSDYYCYNSNWEKVIDLALKEPQHDIAINFNYIRAINNSGQFLEKFFDYHQLIGADCLYPDKMRAPEFTFISSDYYYDLGYISESRHWAFEALTAMPNNIRALKRLAEINLIIGNYEAAKAFIDVLSNNFLCGDFVEKYSPYIEDTSLVAKDNELNMKRISMPDFVHASNVMHNRFTDLVVKNPNNKMAFENMQIWCLLDHDLGLFMRDLKESCKFYEGIPPVYQQAILLYGSMTDINSVKHYPFSQDVIQKFMDFSKIRNEFNGNDEFAQPSLSVYSNTYMYYVTYDSPVVTKATLVKQSEQYYQ